MCPKSVNTDGLWCKRKSMYACIVVVCKRVVANCIEIASMAYYLKLTNSSDHYLYHGESMANVLRRYSSVFRVLCKMSQREDFSSHELR